VVIPSFNTRNARAKQILGMAWDIMGRFGRQRDLPCDYEIVASLGRRKLRFLIEYRDLYWNFTAL
jgi:hypothetical protein